ncbi:MAG: tRNA uridine-5-carboxymethylaminomethyl(34) synthesis GTPase MnmE, partial [Oscillospiraceae bacterium]
FKKVILISAESDDSIEIIEKAVAEVLQTSQIDTDTAVLANARQINAAKKAQSAIDEAINANAMGITLDAVGVCIDDALYALYELTGENVSDSVVDEVFSKFCVGK